MVLDGVIRDVSSRLAACLALSKTGPWIRQRWHEPWDDVEDWRARRLSAMDRKCIASLGGRARSESLQAERRIAENFRFAAAVQGLPRVTPGRRLRTCRGPVPGIYGPLDVAERQPLAVRRSPQRQPPQTRRGAEGPSSTSRASRAMGVRRLPPQGRGCRQPLRDVETLASGDTSTRADRRSS